LEGKLRVDLITAHVLLENKTLGTAIVCNQLENEKKKNNEN